MRRDNKLRRRSFLKTLGVMPVLVSPVLTTAQLAGAPAVPAGAAAKPSAPKELAADLVIIGGGLGGCAAALAAARSGLRVILTEETDWIGGQLTAQAVPPDENQW